MTKIVIIGALGRMGRAIASVAAARNDIDVVVACEREGHPAIGQPYSNFTGIEKFKNPINAPLADAQAAKLGKDTILIDFTSAAATMVNLEICVKAGVPMVIGSTGITPDQLVKIHAAAKAIPIVLSTNYSVGMNLLWKALEVVAEVTGDDYDVEIVEAHHHFKKDSPSGTAMTTAEVLAKALGRTREDFIYGREGLVGERKTREIGIHAVRGGDIVGDHTVYFCGPGERLELKHQAHSRENFAGGALRAAVWLADKPAGLYSMRQVLGLA
jgi:4-hydroxy-tetrahydrodipicolinate reductase